MASPPKTTIIKEFNILTHPTYNIKYLDHEIITTVTKSPTVVTSWITHIQSTHKPTIVGLDTESQNPVSILQLCVANNCLIYQLLHSSGDIPMSLKEFLADPNWTFSGVGVESDVKLLYKDYGISVSNRVDGSRLAAEKKMVRVNAGLKEVVKAVLGWEVDKCKEVTMSRWSKEELDDGQIMYACMDAFLSCQMAEKLIKLDTQDS